LSPEEKKKEEKIAENPAQFSRGRAVTKVEYLPKAGNLFTEAFLAGGGAKRQELLTLFIACQKII